MSPLFRPSLFEDRKNTSSSLKMRSSTTRWWDDWWVETLRCANPNKTTVLYPTREVGQVTFFFFFFGWLHLFDRFPFKTLRLFTSGDKPLIRPTGGKKNNMKTNFKLFSKSLWIFKRILNPHSKKNDRLLINRAYVEWLQSFAHLDLFFFFFFLENELRYTVDGEMDNQI